MPSLANWFFWSREKGNSESTAKAWLSSPLTLCPGNSPREGQGVLEAEVSLR